MQEARKNTIQITYDRQPLRVGVWRRGEASEAIVYLHGHGCSSQDIEETFSHPALAGQTCIAFDQPGCGDSSYPADRALGFEDFVEITRLVLLELGVKKAVIVGHSSGGTLGILFAKKYPDMVKSLVLVSGTFTLRPDCPTRLARVLSYEDFIPQVRDTNIRAYEQSSNKGLQAYAKTLKQTSDPRAYFDTGLSLTKTVDQEDLLRSFLEIPLPKTFVFGSEDKPSEEVLRAFAKNGIPFTEIPNSSHFPMYDQPTILAEIIAAFVR